MTSIAAGREMNAARFRDQFALLRTNVQRFIKGKDDVVELALVCLFSDGHLLIEDVPGVGKTSLARAIAASIKTPMGRIQFTPDLLPSDVTGSIVFNEEKGEFEPHWGPVCRHHVVLADEINRASPKTQSALLEAMEERQVTLDEFKHVLESPFIVMATQNQIELDGTYPLPEAQIDRFMAKTGMGYPATRAIESAIIEMTSQGRTSAAVEQVMSIETVKEMIEFALRVSVDGGLYDYAADLDWKTREWTTELRLAVSLRGGRDLIRAAKTLAASRGSDHVRPDHVKRLIGPVLGHRMLRKPHLEADHDDTADLVERLHEVPVPPPRGVPAPLP